MARTVAALVLLVPWLAHAGPAPDASRTVEVGSKKFTESVILGELAALLLGNGGLEVRHRQGFGGTRVLFDALVSGDLHVYPEYTGTISAELFANELPATATTEQIGRTLEAHGVSMSAPVGFNNTYALGMLRARANEHNIRSISDLSRHPELRYGFSNEFTDRNDGWRGLSVHYGIEGEVRGLDHDLAYRALAAGEVDVVDLYSTDAEIPHYDLQVLEDDERFFPTYNAVFLVRSDRAATILPLLQPLTDALDSQKMARLNARVKLEGQSEAVVAAAFLRKLGIATTAGQRPWFRRVLQRTAEHVTLVTISLLAAIVVAIPLGVGAARVPGMERTVLSVVSVVQTVPSLALLVFMIPLLGIGEAPAIAALFFYSLLPIVRATHAGLRNIGANLLESADALGLTSRERLHLIELPLATPSILSGIKTAAVINVGTATLGALIGAGGYGQPILAGIRLDDTTRILEGAIPAALLAIAVQAGFDFLERAVVPRGLR